MCRAKLVCAMILLTGSSFLLAQDDEKLQSGPKVKATMPKPFGCINVNGPDPKVKGRPNCLVCKFGQSPAVVIFARDSKDAKNESLDDLLAKLDELAVEFDDRAFSAGVVYLSADARDSTNNQDIATRKEKFDKDIEEIAPGIRKVRDLKLEAEATLRRATDQHQDAELTLRLATRLHQDAVKTAESDKDQKSADLVNQRKAEKDKAEAAVTQRKEDLDKAAKEAQERRGDLDKQMDALPAEKRKELTKAYIEFGKDLNGEAKVRTALIERLAKRSENLKHVVVSCYPENGPGGYDLNPKAEITIVFYERMKVIANWSYAPGAMDAKQVESIVTRLREALPLKKKAVEEK